MRGEIPTELGNLVSLINLDISKSLDCNGTFDYFIYSVNNPFILLCVGDYSVFQTVGKSIQRGTIPTELGKLVNWKFVVFCEYPETVVNQNAVLLFRCQTQYD